jgi:dimethylaniline monooxygenase (N-oxide forming)
MVRVAIIGSGMAGIACVKACLEQGLEPVAFEKMSEIGGVWRYTDEESHSSVYKSTHINTGRDANQFGDMPMPKDFPVLLHHTDIQKYFKLYVEKYGLAKHIRLNTTVASVKPLNEVNKDEWTWEVKTTTDGKDRTEIYDAIMVCSGHHSIPRIPEFPGSEKFQGTQLHSHSYKENSPFRGKRVVVVGIGNSGSDIVTEISKVAKECTLVARSGSWIVPNPFAPDDRKAFGRLESTIMGMLPIPAQGALFELECKQTQEIVNNAGLKPQHRLHQAHLTVTKNCPENDLIKQLEDGKIIVKRGIDSMTEKRVKFIDGSESDIDCIVYCTGYKINYPFLDKGVWNTDAGDNKVPLYKFMFPTNRYKNIVWIGLVQPLGSMFMIVDLQSRVAASVLSGKTKLPTSEKMKESVEEYTRLLKQQYLDSPRHTIQVHVRKYLDDLGEMVGATPTIWRLLTQNPSALWPVLRTPSMSASYRVIGPFKAESAVKQINQEYTLLYSNSSNRNGVMGIVMPIIMFFLFIRGIFYQFYLLFTTGKTHWHPLA